METSRSNCEQILEIVPIFEQGLKAPLVGISESLLNKQMADHKMSIGQIAVHCTGWMKYFLSDPKPWEVVDWTCRPVQYPLTLPRVHEIIDEGFDTMKQVLRENDDDQLEDKEGKKGPGYIIMRLLHHINAHSNQMSYLRQLDDPDWEFGSHFGDMATALIQLPYHTTRDLRIGGF